MLLLIDNYDSFTYNLLHYLAEIGEEVEVVRNDAISAQDAIKHRCDGIVISPGPCDPDQAGVCLELVKEAAGRKPVLGVCLGHEALAQAYGATIGRTTPMHGKVSAIQHTGKGIFKNIPSPFKATRYHSLIAERDTIPSVLEITAESSDGLVMGLQHKKYPLFGVQFHPESIASEHGKQLLKNFVEICGHGD